GDASNISSWPLVRAPACQGKSCPSLRPKILRFLTVTKPCRVCTRANARRCGTRKGSRSPAGFIFRPDGKGADFNLLSLRFHRRGGLGCGSFDAKLVEPVLEGTVAHAQHPACFGDDPITLFHRLQDQFAFEVLEIDSLRRNLEFIVARPAFTGLSQGL